MAEKIMRQNLSFGVLASNQAPRKTGLFLWSKQTLFMRDELNVLLKMSVLLNKNGSTGQANT